MKNWRPIWIILLVATALRLLGLGAENFWVDEVLQIENSRDLAIGAIRSTSQILSHFVLQVSETEYTLRFQSMVFSVAEVALLYSLAKRLFDGRTATIAAAFLALSPLHIWYAQEVRWYSQWSLVATATFYLLVRLLEEENRVRTWIAYGALTVLNLYTFVLTVPVMAVQGLVAILGPRPRRWRFVFRGLAVQVLVLLAASPVVWWMLSGLGPTGTPRPTRLVALPYTFFAYVAGYSAGPSLTELHALPGAAWILRTYPEVIVFFLVFGWLAALGIRAALRSRRPGREVILLWALGMPLLMFLVAKGMGGTYNVRYTLVSLPAGYVLLGLGAASIRGAWHRWLVLGAATVCFAFSLGNYYLNPHYDKEDVRGALRHVVDTEEVASPVVVVGQVRGVARYYAPKLGLATVVPCYSAEGWNPGAVLADSPTLWVLVGRDWDGEVDECLGWLAPTHVLTDEITAYAGVRLIRLRRNGRP